MKLTPMDLRQHQFRRSFSGYDPTQVQTLLELVAEEMEQLLRENAGLKADLRRKEAAVKEMAANEQNVREALLTLHKVTQQVRGDADREADLVLQRAHLQADTVLGEAQKRHSLLSNEIQELKRLKIQFQGALRTLIEQHLRLLDAQMESVVPALEEKLRLLVPPAGSKE